MDLRVQVIPGTTFVSISQRLFELNLYTIMVMLHCNVISGNVHNGQNVSG